MVTNVPVDMTYEFPRTELAAMSQTIAKLIQDIDKLDGHRRNMMEELKVLRDITLFYHERHPELRGTGHPDRQARIDKKGSSRQHGTTEDLTEPGRTDETNARNIDTKDRETSEHT